MAMGATMKNCSLLQDFGITYAIGYTDGKAYLEFSYDDGATNATFGSGATSMEITNSDDDRPALTQKSSGVLIASITYGGVVEIWRSETFGETWEYIEDVE